MTRRVALADLGALDMPKRKKGQSRKERKDVFNRKRSGE